MRKSLRFGVSPAVAFILFLLGCMGQGMAQTDEELRLPDILSLRPDLRTGSKVSAESRSVPLDSPVDPDYYVVGPGDILALNIWSSSPVDLQLTVTPEGVLLIPAVGAVDLEGATLSEARATVSPLVSRKYPNAKISLTLLVPRKLTVQISGEVMREGMLEMYGVQRVHNLIEEANTLPTTQVTKYFYDVELQALRQKASLRYITIQRLDGSTHRVDLVRYALTGDPTWNPYLQEGDQVFVPSRGPRDNRIGVYGGVVRNLAVEFVPGDSLSDLIKLGMGLRTPHNAERSVLTRLSEDGTRMDTLLVDVPAILEGRAANQVLRAGDRLLVPVVRDDREGNTVYLEGEFVRPGIYPITRANTRLTEVVAAAGGFTPNANLSAATVMRVRIARPDRPDELEQERLLSLRTSLAIEDSSYYLTETALRLKGEVVAVDFNRLFGEGDTTKDVTLRNFDRVIVPTKSGTVYVFGQVISPGHVPFQAGEASAFYIARAGGFTNDARTSDVKVIKGNTRTWLDPDETIIEDGDFIWVPKEIPTPFGTILTTVAQLATVLAALASVILVANTL